MCGIFGIVNGQGYVNNKICDFVRDGFITSGVRGLDSSGVFQLDKKFKPYNHKRALAGHDFIANKMTQNFLRDADTSYVTMCHVRHATQGKITEDNAHPFAIERDDGTYVIGMHNGTLTNWALKEDAKQFDVDSEWALHMIAKHGADAFKHFTGAYALVWWDQAQQNKLFIARNKERPLHFRLSDDKKLMYIASEAGMLAWLTERNDLKTQKEIYTFEVGKLYEFKVGHGEISWTKSDLPSTGVGTASPTTAASTGSSQQNYSANKGSSSASKDADGVETDGFRFLDGIKMAASKARSFLYADASGNKLPSQSELSKQVDAAVAAMTDDTAIPLSEAFDNDDADAPFSVASDSSSIETGFDWLAKPTWFNVVSTTVKEMDEARRVKVYGDIQWMEGVDYDEDRRELIGDVRDYVSGKGHVTYSAVIRNIDGATAYHFIENIKNGKTGDYAVVTGMYDDKFLGRTLVMSLLSDEGKQFINRKVN